MFTARFPAAIDHDLARLAAQLGMSKSALALRAVQEYLQRATTLTRSAQPGQLSQELVQIHTGIALTHPMLEDTDWRAARDDGRL